MKNKYSEIAYRVANHPDFLTCSGKSVYKKVEKEIKKERKLAKKYAQNPDNA
jgi:hypothetical protein